MLEKKKQIAADDLEALKEKKRLRLMFSKFKNYI